VKLISDHDDDEVVTADSGSPMVWALRHFDTNGKRRTVASCFMAQWPMPCHKHFKKAYPGRQVISLSGVDDWRCSVLSLMRIYLS